jgi:hypothetical protein
MTADEKTLWRRAADLIARSLDPNDYEAYECLQAMAAAADAGDAALSETEPVTASNPPRTIRAIPPTE